MRKFILMAGMAAMVTVTAGGCKAQAYQGSETGQQINVTGTEEVGETAEGGNVDGETANGEIANGETADGETADGETIVLVSERETVITTEAAPAMEIRDETVYAAGTRINVRMEPRTDGQIAGSLNTGDAVKRTGYSTEWSRVVYQGQECFVASRYLSTEPQKVVGEEENQGGATAAGETSGQEAAATAVGEAQEIGLNADWKYAGFSKINTGKAVLYRSQAENRKGKVVCVNAGHGTSGGASVKTQCHPDGTPKVTGGSTGAGAVSATAVSSGMQFADGTAEAKVTLAMAKVLKEKLLARGYDVLMIRESDDVQLDNIARTVIANNMADCHIALHWDSTTSNKGAFYMSVPDVASYRSMEPVASNWQKHHALGDNLIAGLKGAGVKIFSGGAMAMDLTQTSYSTVASVDIELGDKASDHSAGTLDQLGNGLADGIDNFFGN